ncbi:Class I peroxidase protein [Dioscorea alata]|uniref:Class I peroxidase protein n=1 Tax=Dioscorea alata TaxID=55571 RepID=A0ACB7WJZ6_DIOAL|nr:Class I peroxidase protein [Dioscorea alata]
MSYLPNFLLIFRTDGLLITFSLTFLLISSCVTSAGLSLDFYSSSCPNVELLIKDTVRSATAVDPTIPGKLLRLVFHDCIVEGCDGSVLVQGNDTERSDPANTSLGGFEVVENAKRWLEVLCPGIVSCADILVLAARDAVEIARGPSVAVPLGRLDGRTSSAANVRPNMVDTSFSIDEMTQLFSSKGLSLDDLVILSGAHTIGKAHCSAFSERFEEGPKGTLEPIDASLNKDYAMELIKQCPAGASGAVTVNNDPITASIFDIQYYKNLIAGKGLFSSDSVLMSDSRTRDRVESLSTNQDEFFKSWSESFLRMVSIGVKTGNNQGEIRTSCSSFNI